MGPVNEDVVISNSISSETIPSKNYKMNLKKEVIGGFNDELEAMRQAIYKILSTQRYNYIMYSWNYGMEVDDLFGQDRNFVCVEVQSRIREALMQDDRIKSVEEFEFDLSKKGVVGVSFNVSTIFGNVEMEKMVGY